jgi:hypothetical protein
LLDGLIAGLLALAALVTATGGIEVDLGPLSLRSHSAARVLAIALVPVGLRLWMWRRECGVRLQPDHSVAIRIALLTLIALSVGYWFKYLLTSVGGADSYGYASAGRLLASGRLVDAAPIADWLSSPNRLALASPLGWVPSAGGNGIVPTYPLGLPSLMAIFSAVAGSNAIYLVSPVMGLLTLWLVFRLARSWTDEVTAWLATAIVAWNPVFLTYAKQPMSDVPASAWIMLAMYLAMDPSAVAVNPVNRLRPSRASGRPEPVEGRQGFRLREGYGGQVGGQEAGLYRAGLAGVAAGAAFLTRPALILAVAIVPLLAMRGPQPSRRLLLSGIGVAAAVILQASLQAHLFGSPLATGYGSGEALFSWQALPQNVDIYARQSWLALGGLWLVTLGAGAWVMRGARAAALLAAAAAVAVPYLFYIRFDHWETLRFLLPGLVPLSILVAAGVARLAEPIRVPVAAGIVLVIFAGAFALRSERLMRESSVWDIQNLEDRYPLAGQWFEVNTPPQSVALAHQHSGSLRWYSGKQTLRWDLMKPEELVGTVRELEAHGATVYAALEGKEREAFNEKFSTELAGLSVDPVGHVHNVNFLRLHSP